MKRFADGSGQCAEREWRALTLLDAYAPGLAPTPLAADLAAERPTVTMSRLPGTPLRARPTDASRVTALADAVARLHAAVPAASLADVPVRPWHQTALLAQIRTWEEHLRPRLAGGVAEAADAGLTWLAASGVAALGASDDLPPVFGAGDGNLANYLWDEARLRIVDFEDSGRSDRAFELAEITEHVGSWVEHPFDTELFLSRFSLEPAESARLTACRRLLALVWLFLLASDRNDPPRNPPRTTERQAARLLALLH